MNDTISYHPDRDLTFSMYLDYWLRGKGVLNTVGSDTTGFISSSRAIKSGENRWPDIQLISAGSAVGYGHEEGLEATSNLKPGVARKYYEKAKGKDSFIIIPIVNRPATRGEIILKSADPAEHPIIDPKYFENESDLKTLVEG